MTSFQSSNRCRGLSLIEMTLVIAIMLMLASVVMYSLSSMGEWKQGRSSGEKLKAVYLAQKGYLADHPTESYDTLTEAKLIPYLPGRGSALPTAKSLDEQDLTLEISTMPPSFKLGGSVYDPSGSSTDGLWDTAGL